jgi:hemerythrin-like domain-containing protein
MTHHTSNPRSAQAVAAWHADHAAFGRLLDLLDREVLAFHTGDQPNYPLMFDILHYLHEYVDRSHHPREDVAFARLAQREPTLELQVARRLQEHRVVAAAGERLLMLLNGIMDGDDLIVRADVERAAATYLVYYRHHLRAEEEMVIPQAVAVLTPQDWSDVAAAGTRVADPLLAEGLDPRYRELRRTLMSTKTVLGPAIE